MGGHLLRDFEATATKAPTWTGLTWARFPMPCWAQKAENCRTTSIYARRVFRLRICELKKSRIRARVSGRAVNTEGREVVALANWRSAVILFLTYFHNSDFPTLNR